MSKCLCLSGRLYLESAIALSRNANRIKEGARMLFIPVDFRHRPEKIVKSHDSLIELVLVTYRAYRSTRKGKKKKTNQENKKLCRGNECT